MNSCTWNPRESRSSFSGSNGSPISRTTTRWFPTPIYDLLRLELADGPELAQGLGDGLGLADLAVLDGARGHLHLGGMDHGGLIAAHGDLGRPDGGGTDVESDPYLRHPLVLPHMHGAVR